MTFEMICNWCSEPIDTDDFWATLEPGGRYSCGRKMDLGTLHYHTSYQCGDGPTDRACFGKALAMLNWNADFDEPGAGMEWQLVPRAECWHSYRPGSTRPLGTTPLAELNLEDGVYRALSEQNHCFTVEHLVDMRERGAPTSGIGPKRLARIDAVLVERGLLGAPRQPEPPCQPDKRTRTAKRGA